MTYGILVELTYLRRLCVLIRLYNILKQSSPHGSKARSLKEDHARFIDIYTEIVLKKLKPSDAVVITAPGI